MTTGEGYTIRCSVCQNSGSIGEHPTRAQATEVAIAQGWVLTPIVDLCPACQVSVRAALEIQQSRYARIGQEALRLSLKMKRELLLILEEDQP